MNALNYIKILVERFERNQDQYHSSRYNETQARREFIDPLFKALGWDMDNEQGFAEQYKEVIHEDTLEIEGASKAPDYAFRIGGTRKFFVEAKKPAVQIATDIHPAYQLRRYAWSAKLPLSVLTDFEQFAIYDCRAKPDKNDKSSVGRVALYSYKDYIEKWDEIAAIFSKDAILRGSFDKYAEGVRGKKGTAEVDDAFLEEIERWRELLAKNIALRNPELSVRQLNYAVQTTIDRIVFLRICEDRGVERDEQLKAIAELPPPSLRDTSPKSTPPVLPAKNSGQVRTPSPNPKDLGRAREGVYEGLCNLFQQADARYNSGLFHFAKEKDQSSEADTLTLGLKIDDKVLQDILQNLYYPDSPYVFREIPSDILGQVYERFLGKVIRLTAGHQAKVEEKPEVRKAGGVYYTPTYIVDYIVQNTVGKLLEGNQRPEGFGKDSVEARQPSGRSLTPKEVARLKILDPACGSGTFPLGAYQYLLDWHLKWYTEHEPEKWASGKDPVIYQSSPAQPPSVLRTSPPIFTENGGSKRGADLGEAGRGWRLTTSEKKRILLNNIHGVDIDPQAVEVTKLSLLLKVLEGESQETIGSQLGMFKERVLPDLGRNIKCGNSLIGSDYYGERQLTMSFVDEEERYRVNAFDWKAEFPQVFIQGGFDVVMGNPPYGFHQIHSDEVKPYFKSKFSSAFGSFENYFLFYELSLSLLKDKGTHGFIVPVTWLTIPSANALRKYILTNYHIQEILWLSDQVFEDAQVDTLISIIRKQIADETFVKICDTQSNTINVKEERYYRQEKFIDNDYFIGVFETGQDNLLLEKIVSVSQRLKNLARPRSGYNPYEVGKGQAPDGGLQTKETVLTKPYHSTNKLGSEWKPEIVGRDLGRYSINVTGQRWIKYGSWLAAAREPENFLGKRLLVQEITGGHDRRIIATYYDKELYYSRDVIPIKFDKENVNPFYLLGIVNSELITWYHHKRNPKAQKALFPKVLVSDLANLPIRTINFSDPADKARHDKLVSLVERMLALHNPALTGSSAKNSGPSASHLPQNHPTRPSREEQRASADTLPKSKGFGEGKGGVGRTPQEQEMVKREIESTDREIDRLVYELYGLSLDEIKIVEGS